MVDAGSRTEIASWRHHFMIKDSRVGVIIMIKEHDFDFRWLTLIGKTHPEIFLKFPFSGSSYRPFYWKTHPFDFFGWNHIWYVTFGLDEFSSKTVCVTPRNSPIDDWMSFPVKRSSWRPAFTKNWIGTHYFLMDEFSSKTASEMSQKFANNSCFFDGWVF